MRPHLNYWELLVAAIAALVLAWALSGCGVWLKMRKECPAGFVVISHDYCYRPWLRLYDRPRNPSPEQPKDRQAPRSRQG